MYKSPDGWFQYTETWSVKTLFKRVKPEILLALDGGSSRYTI